MTREKRRIIFYLSVLGFTLCAAAAILYSQGYSVGADFILSKRGGLYVAAPHTGSEIFVNNEQEKITTMLSSGIFVPGLKPKDYSVLVAKEGFWPWAKNLTVKEGYVTEARAFMIPQNTNGEIILRGKFTNLWISPSAEILIIQEQKNGDSHLVFYAPNEKTFLTTDAPSEKLLSLGKNISVFFQTDNSAILKNENIFISVVFNLANRTVSAETLETPPENINNYERFTIKGDQKIWWDPKTNEIFADWLKDESLIPYYLCDRSQKPCQLPVQIFKSRFLIKNIDFFPSRKDIILIAVSNGIFALELDKRGGQIIQPVYKGKNPAFAVPQSGNYVWVLDEESLIKINLKSAD